MIYGAFDATNNPSIENIAKEEDIIDQNWFTNTQFGLSFETPKRMTETNFELPPGTDNYFKKVYSYTFSDNEIAINYMIMETNYEQYDTKEGLRGSVSNLINSSNGINLKINFYDIVNDYKDNGCEGTCMYKDLTIKIRGYCLFNGKGRVYMLVASGVQNENTNMKISRVFNSIRIIDLQ